MVRRCDVGKDGCQELTAWLSSLIRCSQASHVGPGWAALLRAVPESTRPGVRADVASASGSLRRLGFRVRASVAVKGRREG